jgi:hypothetical protein
MKQHRIILFIVIFLLSACGSQPQLVPTSTSAPPTARIIPPTETPTTIPITDTPAPTQDPTLFGAIGVDEAQGFALESFANAVFTKTMESLKASGAIQEYQTLRVAIFPGSGGLISEITFNVRTTDPSWLADGGAQADDNWINDKCYRFDFVTTETEYQLKNKRLCN